MCDCIVSFIKESFDFDSWMVFLLVEYSALYRSSSSLRCDLGFLISTGDLEGYLSFYAFFRVISILANLFIAF